MQQPILEIKNLSKAYDRGENVALANFSLSLNKGDVLGLLGPNGAGKTTLISILSGTLRDFSGTVTFKGTDLFSDRRLKNLIGIVPQEMAFYEDLGALENLMFWGGLYDIPKKELKKRALNLLSLVELSARAKEPVKKFSGGMKRRLNVAIGLIHQPELLLLDEPTVGIDVQAKVSILEIIRQVGLKGTSVVFTTHQLSEVEQTCSRIAIMDKGVILAQGTLAELVRIVGEKEIVVISGEFTANRFSEAIASLAGGGIEVLSVVDNEAHLAFADTEGIPAMMQHLFQQQLPLDDLKIKSPNLEAVFLKLTGRSLRD
jgi:ABC-2 type transport system ATP-binding protein